MSLNFWLTVVSLGLAVAVYARWIRPQIRSLPHIREFYDRADGFWQRLLVCIRVYWDGLVGTFLILWPQLPDLLQQFSGIDLSGLVPTDMTKLINQIIGLVLIVLRAINLTATNKKPE